MRVRIALSRAVCAKRHPVVGVVDSVARCPFFKRSALQRMQEIPCFFGPGSDNCGIHDNHFPRAGGSDGQP